MFISPYLRTVDYNMGGNNLGIIAFVVMSTQGLILDITTEYMTLMNSSDPGLEPPCANEHSIRVILITADDYSKLSVEVY